MLWAEGLEDIVYHRHTPNMHHGLKGDEKVTRFEQQRHEFLGMEPVRSWLHRRRDQAVKGGSNQQNAAEARKSKSLAPG